MIKQAVLEASDVMELNNALKYYVMSKCAWYYTKKITRCGHKPRHS